MSGVTGKSGLAKFDLITEDDFSVLRVSGTLAHSDYDSFRDALDGATMDSKSSVIVDLSSLDFICSAGMSLLVQFERTLHKTGRRMMTTGLRGTVRETVEMCGIDKLLTTEMSIDSAKGSLGAG